MPAAAAAKGTPGEFGFQFQKFAPPEKTRFSFVSVSYILDGLITFQVAKTSTEGQLLYNRGQAMRVIAGEFRSRRLHSLPGPELRPTSDRLRETMFDVLTAGNPDALHGSVWLDLFAGTGAVGIEALSRGAAMVYFVECAKSAAELISRNLRPLRVEGRFNILQQDVERAIASLHRQRVNPDFIFLDPPYARREAYGKTLAALASSTMSERALVIAEHLRKFDPGGKVGSLERTRTLEQGDAALSFYRREAPGVSLHQ
jgi:16S rRNA (guanine(966)-N(2))-methyltransferase RsmD